MLLALPFIKWDKEVSTQPRRTGEPIPTIMGDLPSWLSFLGTPDQRLPGDLAIPSVKAIFDKYGKVWTSWYWLGIRNTMMNLAVSLGGKTSDYIPEQPYGFWSRTDEYGTLWRYSIDLKILKFVAGWQVYRMLDDSFMAAPVMSVKRK